MGKQQCELFLCHAFLVLPASEVNFYLLAFLITNSLEDVAGVYKNYLRTLNPL